MPYSTYDEIVSGIVTFPLLTGLSYDGEVASGSFPSGSLSGSTTYVYLDIYEFDSSGTEHKFQVPNYSFQYINAINLSLGVKCNPHRYGYGFAVHCYAKDRAGATDLADHLEDVIRDTGEPTYIETRELIYERDYVKLVAIVRGLASD